MSEKEAAEIVMNGLCFFTNIRRFPCLPIGKGSPRHFKLGCGFVVNFDDKQTWIDEVKERIQAVNEGRAKLLDFESLYDED